MISKFWSIMMLIKTPFSVSHLMFEIFEGKKGILIHFGKSKIKGFFLLA
jgi:hypothetical protein